MLDVLLEAINILHPEKERREQEQRERDRLDKERMERERREREDREKKERERQEREKAKLREMEVARQRQEEERERQRTLEAVNSHFELSIELARKKMGGATGNWSSLPGGAKLEEGRRYGRPELRAEQRAPPPAHSAPGHYPSQHYSGYAGKPSSGKPEHKPDPRLLPGAPAGFRVDASYGAVKLPAHSPPERGYPGYTLQPLPQPRPVSRGSPALPPGYTKQPAPLPSPSARSDPGISHPPPAHGERRGHTAAAWPPHTRPPTTHRAQPDLPPHNGDLPLPLDLGSTKRKSELGASLEPAHQPLKSARLETVSPPGQLHRVTEPSTLGSSVISAEATPITSVVNTAVVITATPASDELTPSESPKPSEKAAKGETKSSPGEFRYVHKLKKAWIKSYIPEAESECGKTGGGSAGVSSHSSSTSSPQLTRSTPSPVGSTKSTGSSKGFPSAVKSAAEALKVNGHGDVDDDNDLDDFSSDNEDNRTENKPKQKGKPGPKPKVKPGPKPKQTSRKKVRSESDNSDSEKDSDSSKTSRKSDLSGRKRGRKPGTKKGKAPELEEPRTKKVKAEENKAVEPFPKPSIAQLKKTGESFLQDASCYEVAPKLNKCRECRGSLAHRQKQTMANIFCRFYAFRRLRFTKNGQVAQAGFCDPKQDAQIEDLKLWLPSQQLSPKHMDKDAARIIITSLTSQFHRIYRAEQEAELYAAADLSLAWKRVVQGVREMCDVCEATLFNKHWACGKCGFVVCIDCYRARVNNAGANGIGEAEETKDKDSFTWLLCNNNKSHQLDTLMLTQIIAGDALDEVNNKLKLLTKLNQTSKESGPKNGWENPDNNSTNPAFRDETDVKDETDEKDEKDDSSTLRDLLGSEQSEMMDSAEDLEAEKIKPMSSEETSVQFSQTKHGWLCNGIVLKLEDPQGKDNSSLFKTTWRRCQPVVVGGLSGRLDKALWQPAALATLPDHSFDPEHPETSAITHGQTIKKFFEGFNEVGKRAVSDSGDALQLRFKENWPAQEDHFAELLPAQYKDLMAALPLSEYTSREGVLNLAARLPDCFVRLDLGPRLWGGYARATYNIQYNVSDAIHVMVHSSSNKDHQAGLADILKHAGCQEKFIKKATGKSVEVGALWHVFHPSDAEKIKEFVNKNLKLDPKKKPKDPLWVGTMYLKDRLLEKLESESGIKAWSLVQTLGDAVIIPAGAPYQVKILNASMYCQSEFVSPEHMKHSMRLSFSDVLNDDRLQVKNVVFHSCKDALSVLEKP